MSDNVQNLLNKRYERLCQSLGDTEYKIYVLTKQARKLRAEIAQLNDLVPELRALFTSQEQK